MSAIHQPAGAEIQQTADSRWVAVAGTRGHDLKNWLAVEEYLSHHHGRANARRQGAATLSRATLPPHSPSVVNSLHHVSHPYHAHDQPLPRFYLRRVFPAGAFPAAQQQR